MGIPLNYFRKNKELRQRLISAIVILAISLVPIFYGDWLLVGTLCVLAFFLVSEWIFLSRAYEESIFATVLGSSIISSLLLFYFYGAGVASGSALVFCIIGISISSRHKRELFYVYILGLFLLPISVISIVSIRAHGDQGLLLFLWFLVIIITTDVMAYVFGRTIGGWRILPRISPNKTLSGCIGGLLCAIIISVLFPYKVSFLASPLFTIFSATAISVSAQAGDFLVSAIKRANKMKDTGTIIPGHGGLFDRLDSFLLSSPIMALLVHTWEVFNI